MYKLILILAGVLIIIYVLLSALSFKDNYCAERELWGINRNLIFIASRPESTTDYTINQLAHHYQDFTKKYKGSVYAESAQLMMGNLYSLRKNYSQARLEFQKAIGSDQELSAQAEFAIAKTYELEGLWYRALLEYKNIIQNYPKTSSGFSTPIYLTTHRVLSGDQKTYTDKAYADALVFYQKMAVNNPKSIIDYNSLRMIAICQLNLKDWSGTVTTMREILLDYPVDKAIQEAVGAINLLCVTKLHDYDMAINIYQQFIQKYPDHSVNPILKKMIKDLQLLKSKKLVIHKER